MLPYCRKTAKKFIEIYRSSETNVLSASQILGDFSDNKLEGKLSQKLSFTVEEPPIQLRKVPSAKSVEKIKSMQRINRCCAFSNLARFWGSHHAIHRKPIKRRLQICKLHDQVIWMLNTQNVHIYPYQLYINNLFVRCSYAFK